MCVRFDDRLATVMAMPAPGASAQAAKWRQLVDVLAQRRSGTTNSQVEQAFEYLRAERGAIGLATRREIADSLAGRAVAPDILAFFAEDHPSVIAPLLGTVRLSRAEWISILPGLSPTARGLLRHRRDLDPAVNQALASFGSSDFVLSGEVEAPVETGESVLSAPAEAGEAQIRDLVARIEAFRKQRAEAGPRPFREQPEAGPAASFRWEAGVNGVIVWVDDAPRGPLVGQSIASVVERGHYGVDGQAAGAFEKKSPFRDARFRVPGTGPASGDWRISGVPFFDPNSGSFGGYRGSARRPRIDEVARAQSDEASSGLFGTNLQTDSLRQLIHELRTPLNAIVGFAEMIDGQYMGPVGAQYRGRAGEIMTQATRLLSAIDDLDTAARIETAHVDAGASAIDAVALLHRLHDAYEKVASQRDASIVIEIKEDLPPARVELGAAERMFARMLAATVGLAEPGEVIHASLGMELLDTRRLLRLSIERPRAIEGLGEAALLDPGYSPDGDWPGAPALGLGFALRLVRNLAEAVGGALNVDETQFELYLPAAEVAERSTGQGS